MPRALTHNVGQENVKQRHAHPYGPEFKKIPKRVKICNEIWSIKFLSHIFVATEFVCEQFVLCVPENDMNFTRFLATK